MPEMNGGRAARLLIVDDVESVRVALVEALRVYGYEAVAAASGDEALELLRGEQFDLLLTDQTMPGLSGLELTEVASRMHPDMPIVVLTGHTDVGLARASLQRGASDFVTKPVNVQELPILVERNLMRRHLEVARLKAREGAVLFAAIKALASAVDAKDPYTARHSMRVTRLSLRLGQALGLTADEMYLLELAAWMHDVGKIGVPDALLTKPAALTPAENAVMRLHAAKGGEIVGAIEELAPVADIIRHHHERFDGKGYPDGLRGAAIPLPTRIIVVADSFEAMTADRSYRRSLGVLAARRELAAHAGSQFDPAIIPPFLALLAEHPEL
jgi:putative two-component system response regulator